MTKDELKKQFNILKGAELAKVINQYFKENYGRRKNFNSTDFGVIKEEPKADIIKAAEEIFNAPEPPQPAQLPIAS